MSRTENFIIPGKISIPFNYAAGETASRFFKELKENKKIYGTRCPACERVMVPARKFCNECFIETAEWVEVGSEGELVSFTVVHKNGEHLPFRSPVAFGIIKLDGADTNIVHLLGETDCEHLRIGMRVRAVFEETRKGNILDIKFFEPKQG